MRAAPNVYLWDEAQQEKTVITAKAYWFNDADYHGVLAAPYFRYSLRVDGAFHPRFLAQVRELAASAPPPLVIGPCR